LCNGESNDENDTEAKANCLLFNSSNFYSNALITQLLDLSEDQIGTVRENAFRSIGLGLKSGLGFESNTFLFSIINKTTSGLKDQKQSVRTFFYFII
jgi:hypothetical protein